MPPPASTDPVARAEVLCDVRRPADARAVLAPVLARDPGDAAAWMTMARALLLLRDYPAAVEAARTAHGLDPSTARPLLLLSAAHTGLRQHREAVAAADEAVRLEPHRPDCYRAAARARMIGRRGRGQAYELAVTAVRLDPGSAESYALLGRAAARRWRRTEAVRLLDQALQLDPQHQEARIELMRLRAVRRPFGPGLAAMIAALADIIAVEPDMVEALAALDQLMCLFLTRTAVAAGLPAYFTLQGAGEIQPTTAGIFVAAAVLLPVTYATRFVRRLPPPARAYLCRLIRRWDKLLGAALVLLGVLTAISTIAIPTATLAAASTALLLTYCVLHVAGLTLLNRRPQRITTRGSAVAGRRSPGSR